MRCPNCDAQVNEQSKFCPHCGKSMPEVIIIENGKVINNAPGCLAKAVASVVIFLIICVALALFVLALPWMIFIGLIIIAIGTLAFFNGF